MNIKKELKKLQPSITEQLPNGAIARVAEEMNLSRNSVRRMLSGEFGIESNLRKMITIVSEIARDEGTKQQNLSQLLCDLLQKTENEVQTG